MYSHPVIFLILALLAVSLSWIQCLVDFVENRKKKISFIIFSTTILSTSLLIVALALFSGFWKNFFMFMSFVVGVSGLFLMNPETQKEISVNSSYSAEAMAVNAERLRIFFFSELFRCSTIFREIQNLEEMLFGAWTQENESLEQKKWMIRFKGFVRAFGIIAERLPCLERRDSLPILTVWDFESFILNTKHEEVGQRNEISPEEIRKIIEGVVKMIVELAPGSEDPYEFYERIVRVCKDRGEDIFLVSLLAPLGCDNTTARLVFRDEQRYADFLNHLFIQGFTSAFDQNSADEGLVKTVQAWIQSEASRVFDSAV